LIIPCHTLRGSRSLSNFTCHVSRKKTLGSRVDAPQKPNCRSLVQGIERQGLRRHLPSRFSVRAESRDGKYPHSAAGLCSESVCSRVPSDRGAPLFKLSQREAEGERSPSHAKSRPALADLCHESASSCRVTP
jgi:hypothetical protein